MTSNTRGPRGRSRKPRPSPPQRADRAAAGSPTNEPPEGSESRARSRSYSKSERPSRSRAPQTKAIGSRPPVPTQTTFGERPHAPWHPLPLSELLILAGAIAFVIALPRLRHGPSSGGPLLLVGIAAVALGTIEVTWREHSSGFRSHTILLALLPVIVLHSVVVLGYTFLAKPSQLLNVGMFAVDIVVFVTLFRALRTRFLDARARAAGRG
jgi:hypothetical protein